MPGDKKFFINHNNRVEPNFHSQTYHLEAKASFKKRMQYNPMESAKKAKKPDYENVESDYAQNKLVTQNQQLQVNTIMQHVQQQLNKQNRADQSFDRNSNRQSSIFSRSLDNSIRKYSVSKVP